MRSLLDPAYNIAMIINSADCFDALRTAVGWRVPSTIFSPPYNDLSAMENIGDENPCNVAPHPGGRQSNSWQLFPPR